MNRLAYVSLVFVFLFLAFSSMAFTFSKCGARAFFLGNGGFYAAMSGMCDQ